ncbi:MAG: alpha/beta fold hydrolase [Candidatus Lokiarchaeota archaeon]|nr:alpha/beta fold hydrolase [Candidatus Lokiarchaeota archaeon]
MESNKVKSQLIEVLRTAEKRFENLVNFPFSPKYIENLEGFEGMRLHYLDEGPNDSNFTFLCLHGQPTWSYLYRKMIPIFVNAEYRVIVPDYYGFGRSDKPIEEEVYTFEFHRNSIIAFIKYLQLKNIILVCQDWGGLIGLTLPMEMPTSFSKLILMNTTLGTGEGVPSQGFKGFRDWVNNTPDMDVGRLMLRGTSNLSPEDMKAYDAPFPDITYKAGIRRFPNLLPTTYDAPGAEISRRARDWFQKEWTGESFMAIGMQDPVLGPSVMKKLREIIPGCPEPLKLKEAGHFVQEWGDIVAKKALESFNL